MGQIVQHPVAMTEGINLDHALKKFINRNSLFFDASHCDLLRQRPERRVDPISFC